MIFPYRQVCTVCIAALALQVLPALAVFGQVTLHPLDKMAAVFEGNYSKE